MKQHPSIAGRLAALLVAVGAAGGVLGSVSGQGEAESAGMRIERGEGLRPLVLPGGEVLQFDVIVDIALLGRTRLGKFKLSAGSEGYLAGLPRPGEAIDASATKTGWIKGEASGSHLGYTLDHTIEARLLPQGWPQVIYRDIQRGSENRMRERRYGLQDGVHTSWYRSDHHCGSCDRREHFLMGNWFRNERHCKKCKRAEHRIWGEPVTREIEAGTLDMLSALYMVRTLIREQLDEIEFPLLNKNQLWTVTVKRAERANITTRAGTYDCRLVKMMPKAPPGGSEKEKFKGLFGIHGTLQIWLHEATGVPIKIGGVVPLGPLDLDVALELRSATGTPEAFKTVPVSK